MAAIQDLIRQVSDPNLRTRLEEEFNRLNKQKKFGLVFEEHLPECTPLYGVKIRVGMVVATKVQDGGAIFKVKAIEGERVVCVGIQDGEDHEFELDDLVAVARFGDPIYPYLEKVDEIEHGGGELWHTLIQADNYHALQLLEYLYPGKVDCIYIDPPYNTGAKDWKYNNDYVDSNDAWRHSKWLSMMERRLALAKKLLNPKDSVLIVTIDEKEYLHLGMLLEQMFPEARIQMVSDVINPRGTNRDGEFSRVEEYIFFCRFGDSAICKADNNMLGNTDEVAKERVWYAFNRGNNLRSSSNGQFYPIYVDPSAQRIVEVGEPLGKDTLMSEFPIRKGLVSVFPINDRGQESIWRGIPATVRSWVSKGYVKVSKYDKTKKRWTLSYIPSGLQKRIENGEVVTKGLLSDGSLDVQSVDSTDKKVSPRTVWVQKFHNAADYGATIIKNTIPGHPFSYPKSLYAVHDTLRFFVANKPNALILDFFAGSGTTLHAVNLLNAEDGGKRRCILVTNNEVSADEAKAFAKNGVKPGDEEWERKGIARYVTWPRTTCSIKGVNVKGEPLKGEYLGGDKEHPRLMADGFQANAIFFKLGFVNPTAVSLGRAFKDILPILWMKAGAVGKCPTSIGDKDMLVLPENRLAILKNEAAFAAFKEQVAAYPEIKTVYLVTDFEPAYKSMAKAFQGRKTYQLYRDYLDNFRLAKTR